VDSIRTFERMHFMRGMENLFMDFAYGRREFNRLLDRVVEWNMAHMRLLLDELKDGIDGVSFSDDWGTQSALFIRPESWRQIFKPRYKEMFDLVKSYGRTVLFHSDGYIMDIIGDLIEAGADVINCQVKLMGAARLAEQFGGRVTFHTDLDRQNILPFGTKDDIRRHVEDVVEHLGRFSGGLILCAEIGHDMPFENIEFLVEEFDRVRRL
jgi:uroporphyrinogen decarboxylase